MEKTKIISFSEAKEKIEKDKKNRMKEAIKKGISEAVKRMGW